MFFVGSIFWEFGATCNQTSSLKNLSQLGLRLDTLPVKGAYREFTGPDQHKRPGQCERMMKELVCASAANELALLDQAARIKELGGRDTVLDADEFDFTPVGS